MNPEQITTRATIADLRATKVPKHAAKPKRATAPKRGVQPGKKRGA